MIASRSGITPLPYQDEGIRFIERFNGRVLLGDDMGLGKTMQALWSLQRNPSWLPALVSCPTVAKYMWAREADFHLGMRASICEGETPPVFNRHDLSSVPPLTIINHDILHHWKPYLKKLKFNTFIGDEAQYFQNRKSLRTKAAKEITKDVDHVLMLSGTPMNNRPADMFAILNMLWPDHFNSFFSYAQEYCDPKRRPWGWEYKGATNLDKLGAEIRRLGMIRRLKADVLKDLPPKFRHVLPVPMSDETEYHRASNDFMGWMQTRNAHKMRSAAKAEALTKLGYLLRLAARLKMRSVVNWANDFLENSDEKLILFAVHEKAIDVLKRRINAKSVVIDGSVTGRARELAKEQFQKDKNTRLCIANIRAGGVALTLTAASTVGFVELWWRPTDHQQAEDRIHRIGQVNDCFIWYFVAAGTIEERLCQILQTKQAIISQALDGGSTMADLNIYEELLDELDRKAA